MTTFLPFERPVLPLLLPAAAAARHGAVVPGGGRAGRAVRRDRRAGGDRGDQGAARQGQAARRDASCTSTRCAMKFREFKRPRDPTCPVCGDGKKAEDIELIDYRPVLQRQELARCHPRHLPSRTAPEARRATRRETSRSVSTASGTAISTSPSGWRRWMHRFRAELAADDAGAGGALRGVPRRRDADAARGVGAADRGGAPAGGVRGAAVRRRAERARRRSTRPRARRRSSG